MTRQKRRYYLSDSRDSLWHFLRYSTKSVPENLPDLRSIVLVPMIKDPSLVPFFALFLPSSEVRCAPLFSSPHRASAIKSRTRLIDLSSPTEKLGPVRSLVGDALGDDCLPITDLRDFLCFCVVSCILLIILAKMTDRRRQEPRQPPNLPIDFLWFLRGILR